MERLDRRLQNLEDETKHRNLKSKAGSEAEKIIQICKKMVEAEEQTKHVASLFIQHHPEVSVETSSEEIELKLELDGAFAGEDQKYEDEDPEITRLLSQYNEVFALAVRRNLVSKVMFFLHNPGEIIQ